MKTPVNPEVGKIYRLSHSRFGRADVQIIAINGEWIDTLVVKGALVGMTHEWTEGETKTVRECQCTFFAL